MKDYFRLPPDRAIDSTDNNEYAGGERDETIWEDELIDVNIPIDDTISDAIDEEGEMERPIYDENG